ncbi:MAG: flagellar hook-associated protein FlgK [Proteobacteria bacterium]|nr:flagellar hook-associated protein FlgK [Pseudomonadota bacterium]MDA1024069.1 flagellar hook-associated protein FlgK [Pseudomonadota bacterium]
MAGITQALRTAQSGLLVNQQTLNAVANNIANVNSVGYSRKIVNTESQVVTGVGAGVQISEIARRVDEGLLKSIRNELGELNVFTVQESFYGRTQDLFGAPGDNSSLSNIMEGFTSAMELLAVSPDQSLEKSELVRRAQDVTLLLNDMSETIQELRLQADNAVGDIVDEMNKIVAKIDQLNDDIVSNSSVNRDVTDLKDQRDQQIDRLSELVDIRFFFRNDGDAVVFTSGGRTLVDTLPPTISHTSAASLSATTTAAEGDIGGIFVGTVEARNDITSEIRGGQLKGLIDLRDTILTNMQSQIDELGAELRDTYNQLHNQGVAFPGAQTYNGTRIFVRPSEQTIKLDPTNSVDDVTIALFDGTGDQTATTTLNTIMTGGGLSTRGSADDWTINATATQLQTWLQNNGAASATVSVNTSGKLDIALNSTTVNLAFRDETATAQGSTQGDAVIAFDANGDGVTDETANGFSNFFGLNDFFVDGLADNIYESDVLVSSFAASASTLTFRDSTGTLTGSPFAVTAGTSLTDLATQITNAVTNVTATVVPDGSGVRLRFAHDNGSSMSVTQAAADSFLSDISMHVADVRVASTIEVRSDIAKTPGKLTTGSVQWNAALGGTGEYFMSVADDTVIKALAQTFTSTHTFGTAGGLATVSSKFSEYAASIVSENARLADTNKDDIERQQSLTDSLKFKSDSVRGVNLDEELSDLITFEQAFSAAGRVIAVIQRMFDALERVI